MIDPMTSLAFSIYSNPGVYALLLGSGISRAANIPTGWDIVVDLINQVALLEGADVEGDALAWYKQTYGKAPEYSKLLATLAPTQTERNTLLRSYFEPTADEEEQALKTPTSAHRAIASLVKQGLIKVILTTNFDRLMETALETAGITPDVISNNDSLKGAVPLVHSICLVVKLNGDYRDTRIKNSEKELAKYSNELNEYLDFVLDNFGLIACGWSAEWDTALRDAIYRCPSRRFSTYWAARSLRSDADELIKHRRAIHVPIADADSFFAQLEEKAGALKVTERAHPATVRMATEITKKYLSGDKYKIPLHDLVRDETARLQEEMASDRFDVRSVPPDVFQTRVSQYESCSEILLAIASTLSYYGRPEHASSLTTAIEGASKKARHSGVTALVNLQLYPGLLLTYGAGIAAVANKRYVNLAAILLTPRLKDEDGKKQLALEPLNVAHVLGEHAKLLPGRAEEYDAGNNHINRVLGEQLRSLIPDDEKFQDAFDIFEYLQGLNYVDLVDPSMSWEWAPAGRFKWKYGRYSPGYGPIDEFLERVMEGREEALLSAGFFGGDIERLRQVNDKYREFLKTIRRY